MSKLVTQRFEYVNYDDATQVTGSSGVVTAYPVPTDQYQNNATASAGTSYGSASVSVPSGGASVSLSVPAGASITMIGAAANTVHCTVSVSNVQLVPSGATVATMSFPVAPSQMVTLPGQFNTGTLTVASQTTALASSTAATSIQLLWSV